MKSNDINRESKSRDSAETNNATEPSVEIELEGGDKYRGQHKNGKLHGKGVYAFSNGDIYEGDFLNGTT